MAQQGFTIREGSKADAAFLARMDYEASLPPFGASFWDELLSSTHTGALDFLQAMFEEGASLWGHAEDFIIVDADDGPIACCAVFSPVHPPENDGPLNLAKLNQIAARLDWPATIVDAFETAYLKVWAGDASFLKPQADAIIETVAVSPTHRGQGLGHVLMTAAFERARTMGAESVGIMVIEGNDAAKALYEKHFEPFATFHAAYFNHEFPGLTKFRAPLQPGKDTP